MYAMTGTMRGTPSLVVAPTQNTAPVYEFRCLFTTDLRKKKRIWHDGSLRFHTFNRRVMVYDDSKNYIGDAHWREQGELQEGEELRLDKGVLVEVGEQIGHSETDLAPVILERRRPGATLSPPAGRAAFDSPLPVPRPGGNIPQAQPKSLTAVLGARQGPLGRARLPAQSPFEQRHVNVEGPRHMTEGRAAKRTRRIREMENVRHTFSSGGRVPFTPTIPDYGSEAQGNALSGRSREPLAPDRHSNTFCRSSAHPALVSQLKSKSHDEIVRSTVSEISPNLSAQSSGTGLVRRVPLRHDSPSSLSSQRAGQKTSYCPPLVRSVKPGSIEEIAEEYAIGTHRSRSVVANKLQLSKEPPRKKLMCKALLYRAKNRHIRKADVGRGAEESRSEESRACRESMTDLHGRGSTDDLVDDDQGNEPGKKQQPALNRAEPLLPETLKPRKTSAATRRFSSPLFVGQASSSCTVNSTQDSTLEDLEPPIRSILSDHGNHGRPQAKSPQRPIESTVVDVARVVEATTLPEALPNLTHQHQRPVHQLPFLESPTRNDSSQVPSRQRPFRRSMSPRDSSLQQHEAFPLKGSTGDKGEKRATTNNVCLDRVPQPYKGPSLMPRSLSDMSGLTHQTGKSGRSGLMPIAAEEACFDPWSEAEAYLLFDWWPPDREKPSF